MGRGPLGGVSCGMRGERYTLYPKDLALILASPPLSLWSVSVLAPLSSCAHHGAHARLGRLPASSALPIASSVKAAAMPRYRQSNACFAPCGVVLHRPPSDGPMSSGNQIFRGR